MYIRTLLVWLLLVVFAFANGTLRQLLLIPWLGDGTAHVLSVLILSTLILLVTLWTLRWIGADSSGRALAVGVIWVVMTVAFEFLAGHYLFGNSWEKLLADYDLPSGRIWPVVLIVTLFAPLVVYRLRRASGSVPPGRSNIIAGQTR